jgi:hypothetical protein
MREKLNSNPMAQVAVIGVLLLATGFFFLSSMGGGEEGESASGGEVAATVNGVTATGSTPGAAVEGAVESLEVGAAPVTTAPALVPTSPPPANVTAAYESGQTVALLFVDDDGIDDKLVTGATASLAALPGVSTFVVPAAKISRYVAITEGVGVERVPALVVVRPKRVEGAVLTASVSYGFQSPQSVVQAVIDARYEGPTLDYHP